MHVVATLGHVDHGKSTLIEALTGRAPDRLAEERRRGLSIELGYCWTDLTGAGEVAFVDVPGHERFITTTLAGVGPVAAVLLVVAADDPWMPQAAEHLAAADALGIRHGVLAVTRSDLADPGPALARAREEVGRTTLGRVPAVAVSGRTGAGLPELRQTLATTVRALPEPALTGPVRLWCDRVFEVKGAGTVVTGTLVSGRLATGDELLAGDVRVRVRGLQMLERPVETAACVARVAVNLTGPVEGLGRGTALVPPDGWAVTDTMDVALVGLGVPPAAPTLHIGSASVPARVRPLDDGHVRLRLDRPLPLHVGDRALLRSPGDRRVWGVRVLDPLPPRLTRRGDAGRRAAALAGSDGTLADEVRRRGLVSHGDLLRLGVSQDGSAGEGAVRGDQYWMSLEVAARSRARMQEVVERQRPVGIPLPALARELGLPDRSLVPPLVTAPLTMRDGAVVDVRAGVPAELREALESLAAELGSDPFAAPTAERLAAIGLDHAGIGVLARQGLLLRLDEKVVLLPGADEEAARRLAGLPQPFPARAAREAWGTTRRVALPLLAHLDRTGRTVRLPDDTRRLRRA